MLVGEEFSVDAILGKDAAEDLTVSMSAAAPLLAQLPWNVATSTHRISMSIGLRSHYDSHWLNHPDWLLLPSCLGFRYTLLEIRGPIFHRMFRQSAFLLVAIAVLGR